MSAFLFTAWKDQVIDNRGKPKESWEECSFKLPADFYGGTKSKAFVGWDGFAIFDDSVDVIKLLKEYALQYQNYSEACGRCAPGRWGGQVLHDVLDKVARGEGQRSDLDQLKSSCNMMKETSKCEIGRTVPISILKALEYFNDEFEKAISSKAPSSGYEKDSSFFKAKVTAPCIDACPAHVDIPAYIEGVRDLRYDDSLRATRKTMPLAHTCGRVCPHPCESECRRENLDSAISIMELKRIGADYEDEFDKKWLHPQEQKPSNGKKVAVIGSGPAGLTGAYYLALEGVECDVYEELPVLGGEVAVGVPEYRMPIGKYNEDIELVKSVGVNFITNTKVDAEMMRELERKYDAILIATGTRLSKKVRAEGEDPSLEGYWPAIPFLDQINLHDKYGIGEAVDLTGKTIVCVGGGFTSMDVVRCSIRAGAKRVVMLYRRDEKTIIKNTSYEEYHEAVEEGVEFVFQSAIKKINSSNGKIDSVTCAMYEMVYPEDGGRPQLVELEGHDYTMEVDFVIPAVSQDADLSHIPQEWEIELTSWNTIK
ncbi:MAG: NADH-ubiquinone oxidoreductase-F iron-sulfur binding region domain-containing protein, partial [Campylobacterales bacterium]